MTKRIVIVGAGAVGGYLGGHLRQAGQDVTLVDPWPDNVEAIRARGLELSGMTPDEDLAVPIEALHVSDVQSLARGRPVDIAIVAVKSYDTRWATALIEPYLAAGGYVVSAQNCINEETVAAVVGWGRTVGCMLGHTFAMEMTEPGRVRRAMARTRAKPALEVGEVHGRVTARVRELAAILEAADRTAPTTNLWGVRWSKLCVNGMRNGVSAATGLGGNARDEHPVIRRVTIRLAGEAVRVGIALGHDLESIARIEPALWLAASEGEPDALATVERLVVAGSQESVRSNLQRPSMAQDIAKGRRTEIDEMNGFIAARAAEVGLSAPTHAALTAIVKRVERGELAARPENLFDLGTIVRAA